MPGSVRENDDFIRQFVADNGIEDVLDVGVGQGTYSDILRPQLPVRGTMDGIEIWEPYVEQFSIKSKYNVLMVGDAREIFETHTMSYYDLIIFGDILEHMTEQESLTMWNRASNIAAWGMISVPIVHYPQGAEEGNPYEIHVQEHMHPDDVISKYGPFEYIELYSITGTFIRRFNGR